MVELADTLVLETSGETREGSTPFRPTSVVARHHIKQRALCGCDGIGIRACLKNKILRVRISSAAPIGEQWIKE